MLISFFELIGSYIGVRLVTPRRLRNNDLLRVGIPIVADNLRGGFVLKNATTHFAQHLGCFGNLAYHNLTDDVTVISKRSKGYLGKCSILADKISRN